MVQISPSISERASHKLFVACRRLTFGKPVSAAGTVLFDHCDYSCYVMYGHNVPRLLPVCQQKCTYLTEQPSMPYITDMKSERFECAHREDGSRPWMNGAGSSPTYRHAPRLYAVWLKLR